MDVFDAFKERHSYRGDFTPERIPRSDLEKIVNAGILAPSGCNAQTTTFVIVDDADKLARLGEICGKTYVGQASAVIICCVDHRDVYHGMAFGVEDCAAAVENMLLAITALGYASVWIDGALRVESRAEAIHELLGMPGNLQVRIALPVGVPAEKRSQPAKKPFGDRAWFNQYGS